MKPHEIQARITVRDRKVTILVTQVGHLKDWIQANRSINPKIYVRSVQAHNGAWQYDMGADAYLLTFKRGDGYVTELSRTCGSKDSALKLGKALQRALIQINKQLEPKAPLFDFNVTLAS